MTATRYLYVTRHGEATPDESALTDAGRAQARALGRRLREKPLSVIHHGPLPRAAETARLIHEQLDGGELRSSQEAGDYLPYVPKREELPAESADRYLSWMAQFPAAEREDGPGLAERALAAFTGPVEGDEDRHELVVTHNFLAGWLVRHALDAPDWRWLGLAHANAGLTVIRYAPDRPAHLLCYNDTRHLSAELRWTGLPAELHI
ncbi:histidine phosphatase family protein [Streptomyces sp. TRM66268-LWL]|uniref:Histidine phosphatase family protein n=1 Tax=Streptomyces polyasparticus TaxID=2767826 RepID=A0ABR7SIP8_9ACTN|nr:histidine phosphatase family protein [Streptomyces polyasparticus]MBC9715129.1 histidine phosphatase family protein [Streptomyces polyasparticus]